MRSFARARTGRFLLLIAAMFALGGGLAYATIPSSGGNVYTACMLKGVGTLRLIDPSLPSSNLMSHCSSLETQVSWNQTGQPEAAGAQGQQGARACRGRREIPARKGRKVIPAIQALLAFSGRSTR